MSTYGYNDAWTPSLPICLLYYCMYISISLCLSIHDNSHSINMADRVLAFAFKWIVCNWQIHCLKCEEKSLLKEFNQVLVKLALHGSVLLIKYWAVCDAKMATWNTCLSGMQSIGWDFIWVKFYVLSARLVVLAIYHTRVLDEWGHDATSPVIITPTGQ